MVLGIIYLIMKEQNVAAASLLALAVHTKTYPIIYAPSIYLLINERYGVFYSNPKTRWKRFLALLWPSDVAMVYAVVGTAGLAGLTWLFYSL